MVSRKVSAKKERIARAREKEIYEEVSEREKRKKQYVKVCVNYTIHAVQISVIQYTVKKKANVQ